MLVMLGILEAGQKKIKEEERSRRWSPTDRRCSKQSRMHLLFFQAAASQSHFLVSLAGRISGSSISRESGARREKREHRGRLVPLGRGLFLRAAAREQCLLLGAWCLLLHVRPCPWVTSRALQSYLSEGATRIRIQL